MIAQTKSDFVIGKKQNVLLRDLRSNYSLYLLILPALFYYIMFCYVPMYGAIIAFMDYSPKGGILGSQWVGLKHFKNFLSDVYFSRVFFNTIRISVTSILVGFPAPIIFALLLNEIRRSWFKRTIQTISYLPHFISLVVVCSIIKQFTMDNGVINDLVAAFGGERVTMLTRPAYFLPIYVISGIWQEIGWGSIIYLAALSGINPELYEAAVIDGANRWKQTLNVTLPGIMPTIVTMLILRLGSIMGVGFEKIILLYNPVTYETADVISSYVYRKGILESSFSFSTAVGFFNSVINCMILLISNYLSRRFTEKSLW